MNLSEKFIRYQLQDYVDYLPINDVKTALKIRELEVVLNIANSMDKYDNITYNGEPYLVIILIEELELQLEKLRKENNI